MRQQIVFMGHTTSCVSCHQSLMFNQATKVHLYIADVIYLDHEGGAPLSWAGVLAWGHVASADFAP